MCARANSWTIVAAVSGKRLGSTIVGCAGQMMRDHGEACMSGSTSSYVVGDEMINYDVELVEPDSMPAMVRIIWPGAAHDR